LLEDSENESLLQISEAARLARSAFGLLQQWEVDWHHPLFQSSEDAKGLQQWIIKFQALCQEQGWMDATSIMTVMIEKIKNQLMALPAHIILFGFTEYPPQLMQFMDACNTAKIRIEKINHQAQNKSSRRINCADQEDEIETAARWAKQQINQHPD